MSTRVMTSCRFNCTCGFTEQGTWFYLASDAHRNLTKCPRCARPIEPKIGGHIRTATFPFTSTHIDGQGTPIEVNSLYHMRQIENKYGVVLSHDSEESPKDLPTFRGGADYRD